MLVQTNTIDFNELKSETQRTKRSEEENNLTHEISFDMQKIKVAKKMNMQVAFQLNLRVKK